MCIKSFFILSPRVPFCILLSEHDLFASQIVPSAFIPFPLRVHSFLPNEGLFLHLFPPFMPPFFLLCPFLPLFCSFRQSLLLFTQRADPLGPPRCGSLQCPSPTENVPLSPQAFWSFLFPSSIPNSKISPALFPLDFVPFEVFFLGSIGLAIFPSSSHTPPRSSFPLLRPF